MCRSELIVEIVLIFLLIFGGVSQAQYSGGSGTPEAPYQIWTVDDWKTLMSSRDDWNKHFILMADLDMQAVELSPIGNDNTNFTGTLDGDDHIINNAVIEQPDNNYIGLFGYLGQNGQISNIHLDNVNISGRTYIGGLVGYNFGGSLDNCYVTGSVSGSGFYYTGGLVGFNSSGSLTACSASGSVSGWDYVGGLAGKTLQSDLNDCYTSNYVNGHSSVGGLVGEQNYCSLSNCSSTGLIEGNGSNIGGLVGSNDRSSLITCSTAGSVSTSGFNNAGGLVGYNSDSSVMACFASGSVSGWDYVGGLIGKTSQSNDKEYVNDCHATGPVNGHSYVGGLVGGNVDGRLYACSAIGQVEGSGLNVGGLAGLNDHGEIFACSATGSVSTSGFNYTGGLVGYNSEGSLTACSAEGSVSGWQKVGGLIGANSQSDANDNVNNCYATGQVTGNNDLGGLVGDNTNGSLIACYAVGEVEATIAFSGGLVGSNGGEVIDCFWDIQTSGMTSMCGRQVNNGSGCDDSFGKTTDQMQDPNTYLAAGWDFLYEVENGIEETWTIEDINYPRLCWQVFYRIAHAPNPPVDVNYPKTSAELSWLPSITAERHDVYFGDNFNDVNDATRESEVFRGSTAEPNFTVGLPGSPYPDSLAALNTYFWRVDEVNDADPISPWKGDVWSFKVNPNKWTGQISANRDDGYASNNQLQNLDADYLRVGLNSFAGPPYYMSGMLFRYVEVPQGARILSAQLEIKSLDEYLTAEVFAEIQAEAADYASDFDAQHSIADRPRTEVSINWNHNEPWSPNTWYKSPDIAEVVQEVINRQEWLSGNSLVILYCTREPMGGYRQFASFDQDAESAPKLEITYEP